MACRAQLVAAVLAAVDGVAFEPEGCAEPVTHTVVVRRPGIEMAADMCTAHQQVFHLHDDGYVKAIRNRERT